MKNTDLARAVELENRRNDLIRYRDAVNQNAGGLTIRLLHNGTALALPFPSFVASVALMDVCDKELAAVVEELARIGVNVAVEEPEVTASVGARSQ